MIIVTSGQPFTDIDAFACAIAYSELLNLESRDAKAVLPGPLNKSLTKEIRSWNLDFETTHKQSAVDEFVLVDVSEPKFFANFVKEGKVIEIFDHRYGFEDYWKEKLGKNSHIEMVGACATLIWEEFEKRNQNKNISQVSANLLYTAIISNTLNFKASVTTERDTQAFEKLKRHINLSENWVEKYFTDQDKETLNSLDKAIINDTKDISPIMAQLELWRSKEIILNNLKEIEKAILSFKKDEWFLTSPSISEGKNYLYTKNPKMKKLLEKTIDAKFTGDIGTTYKLWLRKEIIKELAKQSESAKN